APGHLQRRAAQRERSEMECLQVRVGDARGAEAFEKVGSAGRTAYAAGALVTEQGKVVQSAREASFQRGRAGDLENRCLHGIGCCAAAGGRASEEGRARFRTGTGAVRARRIRSRE